ncbi:LmbE-like protein [Ramaria rubella]|nr:LmbE-like protein [Ramaria rubella]
MARPAKRFLLVLFAAWLLFVFCNNGATLPSEFTGTTQRILFLTAHPDDECMFFAPTILFLSQTSTPIYSLCLSVGNAEGLGKTREQELRKSLQVLGIRRERSQLLDHPLLQDNFTREWSSEIIAEVVKSYVVTHNITVILTFDELGISQHPNHISLPVGVSHLLSSPSVPQLQLFTLKTVPLLQKYTGPVSHTLAKLWLWLPWASSGQTYISGIGGYRIALLAMYQHQSQLVWFRWLYVLFSRYMWVNDWVEVQIPKHKYTAYV